MPLPAATEPDADAELSTCVPFRLTVIEAPDLRATTMLVWFVVVPSLPDSLDVVALPMS